MMDQENLRKVFLEGGLILAFFFSLSLKKMSERDL